MSGAAMVIQEVGLLSSFNNIFYEVENFFGSPIYTFLV
jgi:hypothetical protein